MATDQLTATSNSQSQTTAQGSSLQPTGQASGSGTPSSNVQPGTSTSLLSNGGEGVALHGSALSTVDLSGQATASASVAAPKPVKPIHHVNPALFGLPAVLLVLAIALFWLTKRSVKITT
jgi:hypothetical protein